VTENTHSDHVDLDALADMEEGLPGTQDAAAIRGHLDGCPLCRDRLSRLRTTRALLSTLPPEPMPPEVTERLDAALARAASESRGTIVPMARRARPWNSPAIAGAAAAAAVVVLVGALVAGNVIHRGGSGSSKSSAPASSGAAAGGSTQSQVAGIKVWATGSNYTAATIATLAPRLVLGTPPPSLPEPSSGASTKTAPTAAPGTQVLTQDVMRASREAMLACSTILAGGVATVPVAVDFADFAGKPAVVFALPAIGHPTMLDIWVVRSTCSSSALDLYFARIPRPANSG
jgi:anti-sigma factor RsiW